MSYIRTKTGQLYKVKKENLYDFACEDNFGVMEGLNIHKSIVINQTDTIEELIQIGDIVFYWVSSYEKEHCVMITSDIEIQSLKYNAITKLLIPVGEDYKCVAKGFPSFNLIRGRKYLVNKGKLEIVV
jgi:hypothetical protein